MEKVGLFDEGFGSFDQKNISDINGFFDKLKQKLEKVIIISHILSVIDFCDNILEVVQDEDNYSYIN